MMWTRCWYSLLALQWRHDECDVVSNYLCLDCALNRLFRCISKKTSKLRVTGLCEDDRWPVTRNMFLVMTSSCSGLTTSHDYSPDLNLTPLAAFLRFLPSAARVRSNCAWNQGVDCNEGNESYRGMIVKIHALTVNIFITYEEISYSCEDCGIQKYL